MDKLKMHSINKVDENIAKIGAMFPNCLTERKNEDGEVELAIDFDMLKQELSSVIVEGNEERYQFTWPDKKKSILLANAPIAKTLRPCREESVDFDTTENLYIEGDNLDVLKLLQETYLGKIKMIYIDPPYNTGHDFIYNDDFTEDVDTYLANSGQFDTVGNRLVQNTESNGRFHTDWLNMIYPRLKLAKDLMSDEGVIFISIDEGELDNLKKLCDEVFGANNYISTITRPTGTHTGVVNKAIVGESDYILVYVKNILRTTIDGLPMEDKDTKIYDMQDEFGRFLIRPLRRTGGENRREDRPNMYFPIEAPDGTLVYPIGPTGYESRWICNPSGYEFFKKENRIYWKQVKDGNELKWQVYQKFYLEDKKKAVSNLWSDIEGNKKATRDIRALFVEEDISFDFPKPVQLMHRIIQIANDPSGIVLDFFSGSATTAHAVMQLNAEDGGKRKFIMVQLPEETDTKSEAYKAGYKNICEIGKERIRRAGEKIKGESPLTTQNLDTGFRVLKLDSSSMKDVYYTPADYEISMFDTLADNIKEDRTPEDLLFQVMLDLGVLLSSKIEESVVAGKKVFNVADGFLMACFDENVSNETITAVAKQKPYYFVMRDSSLASDSVATNFDQIFATYSPDTVRKVL